MRGLGHILRLHIQLGRELPRMRAGRAVFLQSRRPHGKRDVRPQLHHALQDALRHKRVQPALIERIRRNDKERRHIKRRRQPGQRRALAAGLGHSRVRAEQDVRNLRHAGASEAISGATPSST